MTEIRAVAGLTCRTDFACLTRRAARAVAGLPAVARCRARAVNAAN